MNDATKPLLWIAVPLAVLGAVVYTQSTSRPPEVALAADSVPALPQLQSTAAPSEPKSHLIVLLDASASFHAADSTSELRAALPILRRVVEAFQVNVYWPGPTRVVVGTIRSASLSQAPICDIQTSTTESVFAVADTAASRQRLSECLVRLSRVPVEPHTDISGALYYASLVLRGIQRAPRGVLLISDLAEDQPHGSASATPDLSGVCVGAVVVIGPKDPARRAPAMLDARLAAWDRQLNVWDAKGFSYWHRDGAQPSALGTFYRDCGRR